MTNMHRTPTEGNICDKRGKIKEPVNCAGYNQHTYLIKELYHFVILQYPNWSQKTSCGFIQNLLEVSSREPHSQSTPRGRPNPQTNHKMELKGW